MVHYIGLIRAAIMTSLVIMACFQYGVDAATVDEPIGVHKAAETKTLSELKEQYPHVFIFHGPRDQNNIALTFDDAPDPRFTEQVLRVLQEEDVQATFFLLGYRAEKYPDIVNKIVNEGHIIGNHSFDHAHLPTLSRDQFQRQLLQTQQILASYLGYEPKLFRPPYGAINEWQLQWAEKNNFAVVNWNVDSLDWKGLNADEVLNNILKQVRPGSIILQHAGGGVKEDVTGTIEALPQVIRTLRKQGYKFVTVPELLNLPVSK